MLVNLRIENFRSFQERQTFSMVSRRISEFSNTLLNKEKIAISKNILPINIIYGANASGKTNIFKATELLKKIICDGTISFLASPTYQFMHTNDDIIKPTHLGMDCVIDNKYFSYDIEFIPNYEKGASKILFEEFKVNSVSLYVRKDKNVTLCPEKKSVMYYVETDTDLLKMNQKQLQGRLDDRKLFLRSTFEDLIANPIVNEFVSWVSESLIIQNWFERINLHPIIEGAENEQESEFALPNWMQNFVNIADIGPQRLFYKKTAGNDNEGTWNLLSEYQNSKIRCITSAEQTESKGTIKLTDLLPLIMITLNAGGTLMIDELDASIHSSIVANMIQLFLDEDINRKQAQLIFNTHNPIYLNRNLVRRDEITFVEKTENFSSELSQLADYCRKDADYAKNYMNGQYGAIKDIDLVELIEEEWT